jgi:hypothetical protein
MKRGSDQFTERQAVVIRTRLAERLRVDLAEAKRIRHELRASRFYISDWESGLLPSGFDALVNSGAIRITSGS